MTARLIHAYAFERWCRDRNQCSLGSRQRAERGSVTRESRRSRPVAERECCKTGNDALRVHRALRLEPLEQRLRRWGLGNGRTPASSVAIGLFVQGADSTSQSIRRPSVRCRTGNRIGRPYGDSRVCRVVEQAGPPATPIRRARRPGENLTQQLGVSNMQRDDPHENVQPVGVTGHTDPALLS